MRSTPFDNRGLRYHIVGFVWLACYVMIQTGFADGGKSRDSSTRLSAESKLRFFERKIRPLFAEHCYECHGTKQQEANLRLDTIEGIVAGGHAGPSIVPKRPGGSLLITAVSYRDNELRMPPEKKLSKEEIADLTLWIEMGASLPDSDPTDWNAKTIGVDIETGRTHWSFQRVSNRRPPQLSGVSVSGPLDAFLSQHWADAQVRPAPPANKVTLIRRATFDLTGLPPTPREVKAFLADQTPQAYERVVDRLLASPYYGERWGRHWLDVARYADSNGLDENVAHGNAWRYRDYVVNSLNADKPYDEFVTEQLAGDLLDSGEDLELRNERLIATGYLVLGPKVLAEKDEAKMRMDIIDEQLDTIGRGILGLTVGCARCHSHKFDPITHNDYYGLAGIFQSTQTMESYESVAKWYENRIETTEQAERRQEHEAVIACKESQIADVVALATKELKLSDTPMTDKIKPEELEKQFSEKAQLALKTLREELKVLEDSAPDVPTAMGVAEGTVIDTPVHLRGSHLTLGEVVPRRFPEVLVGANQPTMPQHRSGRLEFARWLTSGSHPLTARVMVNRVWRGHFGKGLVRTVDNFGFQGEAPTHPQLLDWLATQFVQSGWSLKMLHRMIMLSDAYRRSSHNDSQNRKVDELNNLYWRFEFQRLEAEAIRDAALAISGQLDSQMGGSLLGLKNREYVFNHTSQDHSTYDVQRRSIYLPVIRNHLFDMFKLFDYNDASVLNGDRDSSSIAPQALFLMNSKFIANCSLALADRLFSKTKDKDSRIQCLYELAYSRLPNEFEVKQAKAYLRRFETLFDKRLVNSNDDERMTSQRQAWRALCQSVISSSEFVYVR